MASFSRLVTFHVEQLFDTLLADFLLATVFFTALCFAVLSHRFERRRAAGAMAVTLGLALATGLIWWERERGVSMRDLGPFAAGVVVVVLGVVLFEAFRRLAGHWAAGPLALGAAVFIGRLLPVRWAVAESWLAAISTAGIVLGIFVLLLHRRADFLQPAPARCEAAAVRRDLTDVWRDRRVARRLTHDLERVRHDARDLYRRPDEAGDVMLQLRRILPKEGWLTARLAALRRTAQLLKRGHLARIEQLRHVTDTLPPAGRRKAAEVLRERYRELQLDARLDRLDKAVAENERRVRALTRQALAWSEARDYRQLSTVLDTATQLQRHNVRLLRAIERTEKRLLALGRRIAKEMDEVTDG